jgi:hypothetical protein
MNHDMRCYFYLVFGLVMGFKVDSLIKDPATRGRDEDGVVGFPSFISQPTTSCFSGVRKGSSFVISHGFLPAASRYFHPVWSRIHLEFSGSKLKQRSFRALQSLMKTAGKGSTSN